MSKSYSRFAAWRAQHAAAFKASFLRLFKRPFSSLLSLSVMAIALALPLALAWSLLQMDRMADKVQASRAINVFFLPEVGADEAKGIGARLNGDAAIAKLQMKTPEQGLAEFRQSSELAKAVSLLGKNPLPVVMVIEPADGDAMLLVQRLKALPKVEFVQYDGVWQRRLNAWMAFGQRLLLLLGALFALGAVLAVANNIRLDIAARELEIGVLQQLGAGDAYIRRPYIYFGALLGFSAGLLAMAILFLAGQLIQPTILALIDSYGSTFRFSPVPLVFPLAILIVAVLLGIFGAWLAVGHHLRQTRPVAL
jgi:cell division transport system permease protein